MAKLDVLKIYLVLSKLFLQKKSVSFQERQRLRDEWARTNSSQRPQYYTLDSLLCNGEASPRKKTIGKYLQETHTLEEILI